MGVGVTSGAPDVTPAPTQTETQKETQIPSTPISQEPQHGGYGLNIRLLTQTTSCPLTKRSKVLYTLGSQGLRLVINPSFRGYDASTDLLIDLINKSETTSSSSESI